MVENVIPRPFHYRPIELLPKGTGNRKPVRACLTQCRDRGRSFKIALQVPVGTQLFQEFAHNRITTVRSHPGSICPTEMMSSVRCAPLASAADRKSTRLNSSHMSISYAVFCLKKK